MLNFRQSLRCQDAINKLKFIVGDIGNLVGKAKGTYS